MWFEKVSFGYSKEKHLHPSKNLYFFTFALVANVLSLVLHFNQNSHPFSLISKSNNNKLAAI